MVRGRDNNRSCPWSALLCFRHCVKLIWMFSTVAVLKYLVVFIRFVFGIFKGSFSVLLELLASFGESKARLPSD